SLMKKDEANKVNAKKPNAIRSTYLDKIINTSTNDWPQYHPKLDAILSELEEKLRANQNHLPNPIKGKIFWFLRNFPQPFNEIQAAKIYQIIKKVLKQDDNELLALRENDLSILEDILILARITFPHSDKDYTLFNVY